MTAQTSQRYKGGILRRRLCTTIPVLDRYSGGVEFNPTDLANPIQYQQAVDVIGESVFMGGGVSYYGADCGCKK